MATGMSNTKTHGSQSRGTRSWRSSMQDSSFQHAATPLLSEQFGLDASAWSRNRDNVRVRVGSERLFEVLKCLKTLGGFDMLIDITGVDELEYPDATDRF